MCHRHIFFTLRPPQSASPDSSPVKGELYFVGRGLPDAPMHYVILWGATTSARHPPVGAHLCVRPQNRVFPVSF